MTTTVVVVEGVPRARRDAVARGTLRATVADELGLAVQDVQVAVDPSDRPVVRTGSSRGPWCSITHTDDLVAVAVCDDGPVGVDAERADRTGLPPLRLWCAAEEPDDEDDPARVRRWTCKEAVAKAVGEGLALPLGAVVVRGDGATVVREPDVAWRCETRRTTSGVLVTVATQVDGAVRWVSRRRALPSPPRRRWSRSSDAACRPSPR